MNHRTVKGLLLAAAMVLPGAALAKEAATSPPGQPAQTGDRVLTNDTIDRVNAQPPATETAAASGPAGSFFDDMMQGTNIRRNQSGSTSGQAERTVGPNQPRGYSLSSSTPGSTVVSQGAESYREGGVNDTTHQHATGTAQRGNGLVNNENVEDARGTATAQPGSGPNAPCLSECQKQIDFVRANPEAGSQGQFLSDGSDGHGIKRKPPRNKNRKARRMHKPIQ